MAKTTTGVSAQALADADKYQFQYWALGLVGARPEQSQQKKGADKGIDGRLYITDAGGDVQSVVLSVKGGHVTVNQVRDLVGVITREDAAVGVFICIEEPTKPMRAEAADAGLYESKLVGGGKHPRVQILTITDLLAGRRPDLPAQADVRSFKAAPKAKAKPLDQRRLF
jgi:site-specific DNA-methyltransferase (adenine-specific)